MPKYVVPLMAWVEVTVEAPSKRSAMKKAIKAGWDMVKDLPIDIAPEDNDDLSLDDIVEVKDEPTA